ncbi:MAG: hypothetical protein PHI06_01530, partial [Desulfobulbaceae bacterium]|nr:hypothetical protein [Desulfobulbaceae bacterium]
MQQPSDSVRLLNKRNGRPIGLSLLLISLLLWLLFPLTAQGRSTDSPILQRLATKTKIKDTSRVLKRLREGQPKTRVIVRLMDASQQTSQKTGLGQKVQTIKDLTFRQQRRNEVSDKVNTYLKKFAKGEVDSRANFVYIAGFGAEVSASGLERLADDPDVISIEDDLRLEAHLKQGITLMKASTIRS